MSTLNRPLFSTIGLALIVFLGGCASNTTRPAPEVAHVDMPANATLVTSGEVKSASATLRVNGLSCPLCATNVDAQLKKLPGVLAVQTDLGKGLVRVGLNSPYPTTDEIAKAIDNAGMTLVSISTP